MGGAIISSHPFNKSKPTKIYSKMELKVNRKTALDALLGVAQVASKNSTLPILESVKVNVRIDGTIVFTAFDLEVSVMKKIKVADSFESLIDFCLNPRDTASILKTIKDEEIALDVDSDRCVIKHTKGEVSLPVLPAVDFPEISKDEVQGKAFVDSETLFEWLKNAVKFVGNDKLRPIINGVYMYVDGTEFGVAASDGKVLFTNNYDLGGSPMNVNGVLGSKAVSPLLDMINATENVTVSFGEKMLSFRTDTSMLSCLKPVGAFPKFKMLLQTRPDVTKIRIDKGDLIDSVARTKMTARIDTYLLRLSVQNDTLGVSSEDLMCSKKSKEVCSSEIEGPSGFDIGVNGDNFLACLNAVESDTVEIEMDGPKKAIYIYDDDAPNKRILCMPLLLVS